MKRHLLILGWLSVITTALDAQRPAPRGTPGRVQAARPAAKSAYTIREISLYPFTVKNDDLQDESNLSGSQFQIDSGGLRLRRKSSDDGGDPWSGPVLVIVKLDVTNQAAISGGGSDDSHLTVSFIEGGDGFGDYKGSPRTVRKQVVRVSEGQILPRFPAEPGESPKPVVVPMIMNLTWNCWGGYQVKVALSATPNGPPVSVKEDRYALYEICD